MVILANTSCAGRCPSDGPSEPGLRCKLSRIRWNRTAFAYETPAFRRSALSTASAATRNPTSDTTRCCRSARSEEHTSELQSRLHLVCRLLLEKKKKIT